MVRGRETHYMSGYEDALKDLLKEAEGEELARGEEDEIQDAYNDGYDDAMEELGIGKEAGEDLSGREADAELNEAYEEGFEDALEEAGVDLEKEAARDKVPDKKKARLLRRMLGTVGRGGKAVGRYARRGRGRIPAMIGAGAAGAGLPTLLTLRRRRRRRR